jgi:hypothetical protein
VVVERSELELVWPAALFVEEARALLRELVPDQSALGLLLAEAFHRDRGFELFEQVRQQSSLLELARSLATPTAPPRRPPGVQLVLDLVRDVAQIPRYEPRRYYSARHRPEPDRALSLAETKAAFARAVAELALAGYFDEAFGSSCVDSDDDPDDEGQRQLSELLNWASGEVGLWPLTRDGQPTDIEDDWSEDTFFDVVEALHDRVARPRVRDWHNHGREWDYSNFAVRSGQAVYRWRINGVLDRSEVPLRLAESGSDAGQLVHAAGDPRDELVDRALATPAMGDRAELEHAVGLFRSRSATREDKRSAAVVLARLLEDRRSLIKADFLSGDERALFEIANTFDLRHRKANQHPDYDDAYLDWVFWWYLASVELTDRLVARQGTAGG